MTVRIESGKPRPDRPTRTVVSAGGVVIHAQGRVLLLRRADEGTWCHPKGHLEPGETVEAAAVREIREECGLVVVLGKRIGEVRYAYYWPPDDVNYDKRVVYFVARAEGGEVRLEERFDDWRWFTPERALAILHYRNDQDLLHKALTAVGLSGRS